MVGVIRAAKAGVPGVPSHSTRRTYASLLVALDVQPASRWRSYGKAGSP